MEVNNVHILLVEDNEGDILLMKEALEDTSISAKISVVRDGEKAVRFLEKEGEFIETENPDLIILDINIPKKNGFEVLKDIKSDQNYSHIPVIMFSTSSSHQDIVTCYKNHANCYITKPDDADSFFEAVQMIEEFWMKLSELPTA
ncbi:MAG: response regulator [Balneolaceae bacterium]|nr:response regulator [Balneolaceae bacterium]